MPMTDRDLRRALHELSRLRCLTDVDKTMIATTLYAEEQTELAARLHTALDVRRLVARAAAVLAEQEGVSVRAGHHRLKAMVRQQHRALAEVAAEVLAGG